MTPEAILEAVRDSMRGNLCETLGMEIIRAEMGQLQARMPVDHRTRQPFGLLHGGASVALAETLGSIGANMLAGPDRFAVGMEINANHLRAVRDGYVTGTATLIHNGRSSQVWEIRICDEQDQLCCISRFTAALRDRS
ncbi:MAG: hotdog fold thioesterase [Bacteroidota bacterium]